MRGTNWAGWGGAGYNYGTPRANVVDDGNNNGFSIDLNKVTNIANSIKRAGFDMVRIAWNYENVELDGTNPWRQDIFINVINTIADTGLNIMLVYGGTDGWISDNERYLRDMRWIDKNVGSRIWAYDILNEPHGSHDSKDYNDWNTWKADAGWFIFRMRHFTGKGMIVEGANYGASLGGNTFEPISFEPGEDNEGSYQGAGIILYQCHQYPYWHEEWSNSSEQDWFNYWNGEYGTVIQKLGSNSFFPGEFGLGRNEMSGWHGSWLQYFLNWMSQNGLNNNYIQFHATPVPWDESGTSYSFMNQDASVDESMLAPYRERGML